MSRAALHVVTFTVLIFVGISPVAAEPSLIRTALFEGHVYISPLSNGDGSEPRCEERGGYFTLMSQDLALKGPHVVLKHPYIVNPSFKSAPHRWQIDKKRVHSLRYNEPWGGGSRDEAFLRDKLIRSSPMKLTNSLKTPIAPSKEGDLRRDAFDREGIWVDTPVLSRRVLQFVGWNQESLFYDFLPADNGRYEWYASEPEGNRIRITRWDSQPRVKKEDATKWAETSVWTADVGTALFVTSSGLDRNFVSSTGRVFEAPRDSKSGTPLKELWKDWKTKPVNALIHDVDNAKWYAFTKDQYFEVKNPIKPLAHTLDIARADTATEALETAARCGRVIRGLPEPKDK